MGKVIQSFKDLNCWNADRELRLSVYRKIIPSSAKKARIRSGDPMLCAAHSVMANMAEGYGRFHCRNNTNSCSDARGSCTEVLDHLITVRDEHLISDELLALGRAKVDRAPPVINATWLT